MNIKNLDAVRFIVQEATGLEITYAYEDLVFPEHLAFLIQFDEKNPNNFFCYFHSDCNPDEKEKIYKEMSAVTLRNRMTLEYRGLFNFEQKGAEVEIRFQ